MGQEGNAAACRGCCAPHMGHTRGEGKRGREKEGEGFDLPLPSLHPPPSFPLRNLWKGEAELGGAKVGFLLLGAPPWLPLLPSNLYI